MNNLDFYDLIIKNWSLYSVALVACLLIYYFTYRNVFLSLLDPLNLNILFSCLAASVVVFLFFTGDINGYYFSSYCLTQLAFTVGFFVFRPIKINNNKNRAK